MAGRTPAQGASLPSALPSVPRVPPGVRGALERIIEKHEIELIDVPQRVVLITSPRSGEGVTTIAWWMLSLLAEANDGDLLYLDAASQKIATGRALEGGTAAVLTRLLSEIRATHIPSIYALEAGAVVSGMRTAMQELNAGLNALRHRFRWVVIDAAPPVTSALTLFLARHSDGVVVVLEANRTDRELARNTVDLLRQSGGRVMGAILNKA